MLPAELPAPSPRRGLIRPTIVLILVPALHRHIARDKPVVKEIEPGAYELDRPFATGIGTCLAALVFGVRAWELTAMLAVLERVGHL